jgi:hypothetical protein
MKFIWILSILLSSVAARAELIPQVQLNGRIENSVAAGQPTELRLAFTDSETGQVLTKYKKVMGKFMHLVIVRDDLSNLVHLHPTLIGNTGNFWTVLNQLSDDPDTVGAEVAVNRPGRYFVFAEVYPDTGALKAAPTYVRFYFNSAGEVTQEQVEEVKANNNCEYVTYLKADGKPGAFSDQYRVAVTNDAAQGTNGEMVRFHVDVKSWSKDTKSYQTERGLQTFMRMQGHMFILGVGEPEVKNTLFLHVHGMVHPGMHQEKLMFNYFNRGELSKQKLLKMWIQFKHADKVQQASFVFEYNSHLGHMCGGH